jgi:predicted nucleic acid-binding protein
LPQGYDSIAASPVVQAWDLGAGETAVLSYALAWPDYVAVIDDVAGRRCASSLDIKVIGTVGPNVAD